ncbi:MAG: ThuA domain-containing protein [Chloroflexota bacterium]
MTRVTVWAEYRQERRDPPVAEVYPDGIHAVIAEGLRDAGFDVRTATLDESEHGLSEDVLAETDVLTWWGHTAHREVDDAIVERVHRRVLDGMGLIVLHSAHHSKIFKRLMGTTCDLNWREGGDHERVWVVDPAHPIAEGLGEGFTLDAEEMYGEHFDVPAPDRLVLISWFSGGEVFRSGCCYERGRGRIFYFRPGHETHPSYRHPGVRRVIANAAAWAASPTGDRPDHRHRAEPPEARSKGR